MKSKFLFLNGQMMLCLFYMDIDETSEFNEIDVSTEKVVKSTEIGSVIENVQISIITIQTNAKIKKVGFIRKL